MPHARTYDIVITQVFINRLGFGRRLHDNERLTLGGRLRCRRGGLGGFFGGFGCRHEAALKMIQNGLIYFINYPIFPKLESSQMSYTNISIYKISHYPHSDKYVNMPLGGHVILICG